MLKLTINDFINATVEYHHTNNIMEVMSILKDRDDIIPSFAFISEISGKSRSLFEHSVFVL